MMGMTRTLVRGWCLQGLAPDPLNPLEEVIHCSEHSHIAFGQPKSSM
jgi:hypothetical protein